MTKTRGTTIRLTEAVRRRVDAYAIEDRRSLNRELEVLLTEAMDARDRIRASRDH